MRALGSLQERRVLRRGKRSRIRLSDQLCCQPRLHKIGYAMCATFKLCKHHFLHNTGQMATVHFQVQGNFFRLNESVSTPTPSHVIICSRLQQQTNKKKTTRNSSRSEEVQNPTQMRSCLSWMMNETASSERLWFVQWVGPGKPPKAGRGCSHPVIDCTACNFLAGCPTSHSTNILLCAFYTRMLSFC